MVTWAVVLLAGAAAYAFRLLPLLAADRLRPGPRVAAALRHAGVGALTALVVLALLAGDPGGTAGTAGTPAAGGQGSPVPLLAGAAAGAVLALRGRSMLWVVLGGLATQALLAAVLH